MPIRGWVNLYNGLGGAECCIDSCSEHILHRGQPEYSSPVVIRRFEHVTSDDSAHEARYGTEGVEDA